MQPNIHRCSIAIALTLAAATAGAAPPPEVARVDLVGTTLSWSATAGADAYNVYRGEFPAAYDQRCLVFRATTTTAEVPQAPSGRLYYYVVSAVNNDGEGPLAIVGGLPVPNSAPCDPDGDGVASDADNCPLVYNPDQADQNEDVIGDRCDPKTYDFEADTPGLRPAEMSQIGGFNPTLLTRDYGGDLGIASDDPGRGIHDVFDRLPADQPLQDTTVWVDFDLSPEVLSVELWSDGAYLPNAGAGLILQVGAGGDLVFYERHGSSVPAVMGPLAPATGRMRLRLIKGVGTSSALHVDGHDGSDWMVDLAVFPVADDHTYRGLWVSLGDYIGARRGLRRLTIERQVPPGNLVIHEAAGWSASWKLFQRDPSDRATIPLWLSYRLDQPGELRARVVRSTDRSVLPGHDWIDHTLPVAAALPGQIGWDIEGVPTGGNYDVEIELRLADTTPVASAALVQIAVGDLYLAAGQSNMSGYSGNLLGAEAPIDQAHLFHNDGTWKRASEPMDGFLDQTDGVSFDLNAAHSAMLRFAKEVHAATDVPIGLIPGPLGGSDLYDQWQRNPTEPADRGTLYGSLLHRAWLQGGNPPRGLLWFQGESDAVVGRTTAQYRTDLERLIANVRQDLGNPELFALVAQLGTFDGAALPDWLAVQEAQRQLADADSSSALIVTVDQPRVDPIHFTVDGYKELGVRFGEAARAHIYGEILRPRAHLIDANALLSPDQIELLYDRPLSDGDRSLYRITDSGITPPSVTALSLMGSTVLLQLNRALVGTATLSYGYATTPSARWLRDDRGKPVAVFADVPVTF